MVVVFEIEDDLNLKFDIVINLSEDDLIDITPKKIISISHFSIIEELHKIYDETFGRRNNFRILNCKIKIPIQDNINIVFSKDNK